MSHIPTTIGTQEHRKLMKKYTISLWLSSLITCLVYLLFSMAYLELPGIYFDAANPDYLSAKYLTELDPYINHFPPWTSFPVLGQLYHGMTHFYLGNIFFSIFGISFNSLRIMHLFLGLFLTLICLIFLRKITKSDLISLLIAVLFACDPALTYAFRTQSYITISPMIFFLISTLLLFYNPQKKSTHLLKLFCSFALFGFSVYGYFIYILFLPAFIYAATINKIGKKSEIIYSTFGFFLGISLYLVGYAQVIYYTGSFDELIKNASGLNVLGSKPNDVFIGITQINRLSSALSNNYNYLMIFSEKYHSSNGYIKLSLLLFFSIFYFVFRLIKDRKISYKESFPTIFFVSFFVLSIVVFNDRLGSHHYIALLPLLYIQLAIAFSRIIEIKIHNITITLSIALIALSIGASNLTYQYNFQKKLVETGGVGYYSDSLKQLAYVALHPINGSIYIFPEWGFSVPFLIMTEGRIHYRTNLDPYDLGKIPCGTQLNYVTWGDIMKKTTVLSSAKNFGQMNKFKYFYERSGNLSFSTYSVTKSSSCPH